MWISASKEIAETCLDEMLLYTFLWFFNHLCIS